ncbi:MAG: ThuA domain-containing protein [Bacteroidetes bacterium]|nr:MAG: ThuA domain-containing protein [Bacteroidota bacterium]
MWKKILKWTLLSLLALFVLFAAFVAWNVRFLWQKPRFDTEMVADPGDLGAKAILVFSKTNGYRHASIETALPVIRQMAEDRGWAIVQTENAGVFNDAYLARFDVLVFVSTTGELFTPEQKEAFKRYMENGGGWVGMHAASDTEHPWDWYETLVGAEFKHHTLFPQLPEGELVVEDREHPTTFFLPERWRRADEWYSFTSNPRNRPGVHVLYSLDESVTDMGSPGGMGDHPIAWTNEVGQGRVFYTAIGHTEETFTDPMCLQHLAAGITWAGRLE